MNVKQYWEKLIVEIKQFDSKEEKKSASIVNDKDAFEKLKNSLLMIADHGIKSQESWNPLTIKEHLSIADKILKNDPFDASGVPQITGTKTRNFIHSVYLPHVKRFDDIEFSTITITAADLLGKSIETKREESREKAIKLEKMIAAYDKEQQASIATSNIFSKPVLAISLLSNDVSSLRPDSPGMK